jgi:hypothetical protein
VAAGLYVELMAFWFEIGSRYMVVAEKKCVKHGKPRLETWSISLGVAAENLS